MAFIEKMKAQRYIEKTREYLDYLEEHIENVRLAFCNLSKACDGMWWVGDDMTWHQLRQDVESHDLSKFHPEEFVQYRNSFFPVDGEVVEKREFTTAWENHKACNAHHHESITNDIDIVHMVIDWTAMGYKFGDTAQKYYEANKNKIGLSDDQIKFMYEIFDRITEAELDS